MYNTEPALDKIQSVRYFLWRRIETIRSKLLISNIKIREVKNMELKYVIPNLEKIFGNLEYAGEGNIEQRRINGRSTILS
ncbi:hypothetical protein CLPUN_09860 [Clostridium puniceum]|uniref:Uncharacterized protein n=1 Tax=Clostridium puniceum TaxID=29367 RepID=A0A1S8TV58_9CLOT|nr:hypothetical protein CLPUN_09860 [Clostridium puniceum]